MYRAKEINKYNLVILDPEDHLLNLKNLNEAGEGNVLFTLHYTWDDGYEIYETDSRKMVDTSKPYCVFLYDGLFVAQYETKEEFDGLYEIC